MVKKFGPIFGFFSPASPSCPRNADTKRTIPEGQTETLLPGDPSNFSTSRMVRWGVKKSSEARRAAIFLVTTRALSLRGGPF